MTIGYDTPWRQVAALLTPRRRTHERRAQAAAAGRPEDSVARFLRGVHPARLPRAQDQRVATLDKLHENILDTFNEYGVQITSPNYEADPGAAKVVPRERWYDAPAVLPGQPSRTIDGSGVGVSGVPVARRRALLGPAVRIRRPRSVWRIAVQARVAFGRRRQRHRLRVHGPAARDAAHAGTLLDGRGRAGPFPFLTTAFTPRRSLGFLLFYALEHIVAASRPPTEGAGAGRAKHERRRSTGCRCWGLPSTCGLMAYLLREDAESRALLIVPYGFAMFCHLWIVDHALRS